MIDLSSLGSKYKLVYLDPPWAYWGSPDKDQAAGKHYNMMSYDELKALPVRSLIADPGVVFMWATGPKLDEAVDLLRAWGFHYRGIAYVWVKTSNSGKVIEGQGVRPSFVKITTELVLIGSTEPRGRTLPILTESQGQVVFAPRGDEHSEKPEEVRYRIEELFGPIPRIELFARRRYAGWDAWGLESEGSMPSEQARSPKLKAKLQEQEHYALVRDALESLPQE